MKTDNSLRARIERKGWKITRGQARLFAEKRGQQTIKANSLTQIYQCVKQSKTYKII